MTIHPIIFIAQFEPAFDELDLYGRVNDRNFPTVTTENDEFPEYEIERLVGKRFVRNRFQYLVKWKSYGMEHNTWYNINDFGNAKETIINYEELNERFPQRFRRRPKRHVLPETPLFSRPRRFTAKKQILISAEAQPAQRGR